jgi:hypothetical protein
MRPFHSDRSESVTKRTSTRLTTSRSSVNAAHAEEFMPPFINNSEQNVHKKALNDANTEDYELL